MVIIYKMPEHSPRTEEDIKSPPPQINEEYEKMLEKYLYEDIEEAEDVANCDIMSQIEEARDVLMQHSRVMYEKWQVLEDKGYTSTRNYVTEDEENFSTSINENEFSDEEKQAFLNEYLKLIGEDFDENQ